MVEEQGIAIRVRERSHVANPAIDRLAEKGHTLALERCARGRDVVDVQCDRVRAGFESILQLVTIHRLDPTELRVLGCLIEKQRTTPEQYPLTLNALRLACNQATNREPVLELDESQVRAAAQSLGTRGYARLATGPGSRTAKYRQLFGEALDLLPSQVSVLAVLMLRGPQTVAELKTRCERLHHFADTAQVESTLAGLDERELVELLPKRPGQREERWTHLLAETATRSEEALAVAGTPVSVEPTSVERRLQQLEDRIADLERLLAERGLLN
jgi:uncharacterized protein